jgi:serine/threonine protein kinase
LFVEGVTKLTDFGWSNLKDCVRTTYCGTPDYLAPEMVKGIGHSEKLDIWTIGILCFELLNGHAPFTPKMGVDGVTNQRQAKSALEKNILNNEPIFSNRQVSPKARDVILKMLTKDAHCRPSAAEILEHEWFSGCKADGAPSRPSSEMFSMERLSGMTTDSNPNVITGQIKISRGLNLGNKKPAKMQSDNDSSNSYDAYFKSDKYRTKVATE